MNDYDRPYRMPTAVGERRGSIWADLFAFAAIIVTSIVASAIVAWMTHGFGKPMFSGLMGIIGWARWLLDAFSPAAYLSAPWHPAPLTAFGWRVVWGIGVTWAIGAGMAFAGWFWITIACEPKSTMDVSQIKDSARMADESDYRLAGFLSKR